MIYDIKDYLKKFFSSRLFVLAAVMILLFAILAERIFSLQIVNGAEYQKNFIMLIKKPLSIDASRGNIYDCNGNLLAFNQLAYSVVISDNGNYSSTKEHNRLLNKELKELIAVIKKNGGEIYKDFPIDINEDGTYSFNITSETSRKRFLSDVFGKKYEKLEYNKKLGFDEANATAENVIDYLRSNQNECFDVSDKYDKQTIYDIVVVRYAIKQNRFTKYKTTTIAKDVNDTIVAYVNEHSDTLTGVSIEEDTIRKYNYAEYISPIVGYTGKISTDEYNKLSEDDSSYTQNDMVGKSGLEQYYESYLRGKNGEKQVYVNNVGKITDVISQKNSVSGNDVYLSIDIKLQEATYKLLEQEIAGIVYSKIKSGEIPITDVYFALLNNNVIDLTHFNAADASATEQSIYTSFSEQLQGALGTIDNELQNGNTGTSGMSEQVLDYFTCVMSMLSDDGLLLSDQIDSSDSTYTAWKEGTVSPKDYLKYCISKQWIDITKLDVNQKYADSSEVYSALCSYIENGLSTNKDFAKIIYKYMVNSGAVTGQQLCLLLFDQGVLDYDDATVNNIANGSISPYAFLMDKINNIEITPAQLALDPCTGSSIITDINTGQIKAMVSYPGYDNNKLANTVDADYYQALREDKSNPLWNYATQEQTAPGSTFKMVSSTAGLAEGVIDTSSKINCTGIFTDISNQPKCWIYPGAHGMDNVSEALRDSCNVFFYTTGFRLASKDTGSYDDENGMKYIQKYASIYGLNEKSGLEIVEKTPSIATQYPVMAAIGQSNNNFTTVSLSRYVTAVVSGKLYDYKLMNKITDADGKTVKQYDSKFKDISDTLNQSQWDAIHQGMRMVVEDLHDVFGGFTGVEVAGKTGTAQQVENRPNHALFVGYAPYSNPEISIATRISYGYSSHNAAAASRNIISYYYNLESLDDLLSVKAEGVNSSGSSARTD
ncbi:MAG: penicillin-binding transpeptidase domain-containing protein [Agathobacter sp.]|uniref:peptidoglycan D,D-transpeptidase FtsI family protein n=1 Tax=Agathobacter sp. TaxID=2021311 RepID=UPI002E7A7B49|nr:penicillin-binding transpeptidase domain-containing protein [Agathobacter sp.]MEE1216441.1 penicillin-binding transpeptidase domain-containing protein [Agathobacter sp.]